MIRYERLGWLASRRFGRKLPDEAQPMEPWLREPRRLDLVDRAGQPLDWDSLDFVRRARASPLARIDPGLLAKSDPPGGTGVTR